MMLSEVLHGVLRLKLELWFLVVGLLVVWLYPRAARAGIDRLHAAVRRFAANRGRAVLTTGLLAFGSAAFFGLVVRFPEPWVHDEFSYLLAADTFASGRLANPPHPMREFFETFYVIQEPAYASQYPPAPGLLLAVGQRVFGSPAVSVWIGAGLATAAVTWMLQGWVPCYWAFVGGLLAASRIGFSGPWAQSYFTITVAAAGGALVFGATRRLYRRARARDAAWFVAGLLLLAHSRPFEGFAASLAPLAAFALRPLWLQGAARTVWLRRAALPAALLLPVIPATLAGYNYRVTGDPLELPYQLYERTYSYLPIILLQSPGEPPRYRHRMIEKYYTEFLHDFDALSRERYWELKGREFLALFIALLGGLPLAAIALTRRLSRGRWMWFAYGALALGFAAMAVQRQAWPRKAAPAACLLILIAVWHLRLLDLHRRKGVCGRAVARLSPPIVMAAALLTLNPAWQMPLSDLERYRPEILERLRREGGRHLIVVRYADEHDPNQEWVYNRANIDAESVVWARELSEAENDRLFDYFADRTHWLLEPDRPPLELRPYRPRD